jgi:hypothetical protein
MSKIHISKHNREKYLISIESVKLFIRYESPIMTLRKAGFVTG